MNRLTQAIANVANEHLLEEKWLLAPSLRVGHQWLDAVARSGQPLVNFHVKTLVSMGVDLAAPTMATRGVTLASPRGTGLLVDRGIELNSSLSETVLQSINAVRLAGLAPEVLTSDRFEVDEKGKDFAAILAAYLDLLQSERLVDYANVLRMAATRLSDEPRALGAETLVLMPEDTELSFLEQELLESIPASHQIRLPVDTLVDTTTSGEVLTSDLQLFRWLLQPSDAPSPISDGSIAVTRSVGEVNEIRGVLRACLSGELPWDTVELLHTDTQTYVMLVYETLAAIGRSDAEVGDEPPVTFAEGIPCIYSRPGRALLEWLHWIANDFPQATLVKMIKEGLLVPPTAEGESLGFARLAELLRGVGIGFGRER